MSSSEAPVLVSGKALRTITLNRPQRLNTFTNELAALLQAAMQSATDDPECRAIVLTGAGRAFCAGIDLADLKQQGTQDLGKLIEDTYNPLMRIIGRCPKPIVGAINGVAAGGGCGLALACDIVIASERAFFVSAFAALGLVPDCGGTHSFTQTMGLARATAFALLDEQLPATEAAARGVIWKAVAEDQFAAEVTRVGTQLAQGAPAALAAIKAALRDSPRRDWIGQLDIERDLQGRLAATADHAEGLAAFLGKRQPQFQGS